MKTNILIVSYAKDLEYLKYCLKSISKFASGFGDVKLVVPEEEAHIFYQLREICMFSLNPYERTKDPVKWHLDSQLQKCYGDRYCQNSDFVFNMDSDCVFNRPVTPNDFFHEGKPILPYQSYASLPSDVPWKVPTETALGMTVENEYMRRPGLVYPVGLYKEFRNRVERVHEKCMGSYILNDCKPTFPWGVSEFNSLGAFAHNTPRWFAEFRWLNTEFEKEPVSFINQYWSHAGVNEEHNLPSGGRGKPMDDFRKLGLA